MASQESVSVLVNRWLDWDQDPETREEIIRLRDSNDTEALEKCLRKRIRFGTAGLRSTMQAGFSFVNSLTVIQTSQGLAKFITDSHRGSAEPTVVIGHDSRHNSRKFALLAARAFEIQGIHVLLFCKECPTPFVPYTVVNNQATAGVMITASHNPAKDNGYKLYWSNGAQIKAPMDGIVSGFIEKNLEPWSSAWSQVDRDHYARVDLYNTIMDKYCQSVCDFAVSTVDAWEPPSPFVYTPLHGVGFATMARLCERLGINDMVTVEEQKEPDPDFPTVVYPNPEENGALDLAIKTADRLGRDLVLANDPDADRFALVEKVNGTWVRLTGDQIGVLLASHVVDAYKKNQKGESATRKLAMLTTAVSSDMLRKMAEKDGFHVQETLTGFKWLGNVARELEQEDYNVIYGFEEALGYMFTPVSYDKDGLAASVIFLAAEAKWRREGLTPYTKLQQLYSLYGHHEQLNTYFVSPDPVTSNMLFEQVSRLPKREQTIGRLPITRYRNMTDRFDSGTRDHIPVLPVDHNSQMLTIWSDHGVKFTLRASGTEPKVKIYIESCCPTREEAVEAVCHVLESVLEHWIKPYAPTMTYAPTHITSSGHVIRLDKEE